MIFWVIISYWNRKNVCLLKYLDIDHYWIPSLMCYFLENTVISTSVIKSYFCIMWLKFFNTFYSISWQLSNQYSSMHINVCMQKGPTGLFWNIFNIIPSYFWIIQKYFTSFFALGKYHLQWLYKREEISLALERILIHFRLDYLRFIFCLHQLWC